MAAGDGDNGDYGEVLAEALKSMGGSLYGFSWPECPCPCDKCQQGHKYEWHVGPPRTLVDSSFRVYVGLLDKKVGVTSG